MTSPGNRLLGQLTVGREILAASLERVDLKAGDVLAQPGKPLRFAYFLRSGIAATVLGNRAGQQVEVGLTGNEGMIGLPLLLGATQCPRKTMMLVDGAADRIPSQSLTSVLDAVPAARDILLRFVHTFIIQLSSTVLATGSLTVERRLARWLLMAEDRLGPGEMVLTHDFFATVLGVRRPGVTVALHVLEGEHLVRSRRGRVTILDRVGLQSFAGDSYGIAEAEYQRALGAPVLEVPDLQLPVKPRGQSVELV